MGLKGLLTSVKDVSGIPSNGSGACLSRVASAANLGAYEGVSGRGMHRSSSEVFNVERWSSDSSEFSGGITRKPGYVSFVIPRKVFCWMKKMAVHYNYGSVNKSVRDALVWAASGEPEDIDWMFTSHHEVPSSLDTEVCEKKEKEAFDIAQKSRGPTTPCDKVVTGARLPDSLYTFVMSCMEKYDLASPSDVLEVSLRCAISLGAEDDVFGEHEVELGLPRTTVDLYHDLGIIGLQTSSSPASSVDLSRQHST